MNSFTNTAADDPFGNQLIEDMRWLGRLAARLVADPGLADDACQEAWMSASAGGEQPPTREQLAAGVRRFLLMHWRGSARRRAREQASARADGAPAVDQLLARRESQMRIWSELVELGDPHRQTLLMRFQEGLSTRQIAGALNMTQDTVRRHIREGVAMLRRRLEDDHEGGGLAAIAAAIPASLRGVDVAAESGLRAGISGTGLKVGAAIAAIGVCVLVLRSVLTGPVEPLMEPMSMGERTVESPGRRAAFLEPVLSQGRLALVAPSAADDPAVAEPAAGAPPEASVSATSIQGQEPYGLRVRLRTLDGFDLPRRVSAKLEGLIEGGSPLAEVKGERDVIDGHFDMNFSDEDAFHRSEITRAHVTVTAEGFGTQTRFLLEAPWASRIHPSVDFFLYPASTLPVRVMHAESGEAIHGARLVMRGASDGLTQNLRTDETGLAILPLIVSEATHVDVKEDHLFVQADGTAIGHWTRGNLERLPLQRDGTRVLELAGASTLRGSVLMESGGPVPAGAVVAYSMERSRELTTVDFPHWMAPDGRAVIDEGGHFEIDGLTEGLLLLHPKGSPEHEAAALGPWVLVDVNESQDREVTLLVPSEPTVLTLHLEWLSPEQVLFVRLYEIDSTDAPYLDSVTPRKLLAKRDWLPVLEDVPILLPHGSLEEGQLYLLEVGPDFDNFLERQIIFDGDAPRLEHSFADVAALECPLRKGDTPQQQLQSKNVQARARKAGALAILRARTE